MKWLLGSVGLISLATAANAQTAPSTPTTSATETEGAALGEIVVTASRREETVQKAALSVQAITGDALRRANVSKPEDISKLAPGVSVASGGNVPQVFIRGVGNAATNALAEGAVAIHLDGIYISQPQATRGMFYDLERVEVLKGPQGTLYGRNASGGAMNVITAKPKLGEFGGYGEVAVGNYNLIQFTSALNVPLGEDLALRVAGQFIDRDGYLSDGSSDEEQKSVRAHLLWRPNDDLSLLLSANYQHIGGRGAGGALKPQLPGDPFRGNADPEVTAIYRAQPGLGPLFSVPAKDNFVDNEVRTIGAEMTWNLGFGTLTLLPGYRDSILRDKTYVPGFPVAQESRDKQTTVEARLSGNSSALKWVIGGYFFDERTRNRDGRPSQIVNNGPLTQVVPHFDLHVRSYAAFGQLTYSLTPTLRLTGGLRYTYEKKILNELIQVYTPPSQTPTPLCPTGTVFDPAAPTPPRFCRRDVNGDGQLIYNNVTFKAGAEYDVAPRSMLYVNLSTGFKSGGFSQAPAPNTFRPEKLTAIEIGSKNRFLDNRLQVNVEGFYWKYKDHQETAVLPTSIPDYSALLVFNAGKATSYGADLDVVFRATPVDELNLKVQYNHTNYDSFTYLNYGSPPITGCAVIPGAANGPQTIDCSGKQLVRAPLWSGTASYTHTFDLVENGTLDVTMSSQFSSAFEASTDFVGTSRQKAYILGDLDLSYTPVGGRWTLSAFLHNVANTAVYTQVFRFPFIDQSNPLANSDGLFNGGLRAPRTFGARLRVNL